MAAPQLPQLYYGITEEGLVRGVMLNQKERDVVRLDIDKMERTLRPRPMPQSIAVEFVPVLRTPDDSQETVSLFVIEMIVHGAPDTLYITSRNGCYLRDKPRTTPPHKKCVPGLFNRRRLITYSAQSPVSPADLRKLLLHSPHRVVY
ncbi:hypothetical protein HPB51_026637 [Rhipicephalus microplus]|uniref:Uncharacterized protein n=1 Tax=Rhipicephalus microplus TaxID=6941 RepID=A0A9J6D2C8_RHIMP|nr:hypothetical protein HPB51_026637 [Rhipicephalus microplus]